MLIHQTPPLRCLPTVLLRSPGRSIVQKRLQSLIRGEAMRLNANSRYFLDTDGWSTYRSNRRRRARFAMTIILTLAGTAIALRLALR